MEAYERLRTAVVKSAVDDYKKALKKSDRVGCVCEEQKKLEAWFMSRWGQVLSGDNGEYIIEKCRQSYRSKTHRNGKKIIPDEVQVRICDDFRNGVKRSCILRKYGITDNQLYYVLRRWDE